MYRVKSPATARPAKHTRPRGAASARVLRECVVPRQEKDSNSVLNEGGTTARRHDADHDGRDVKRH